MEVQRVVNVDRCPDFDPKPADIVICMTDLMSHAAHDRAKLIARKNNRPFVALTRKAADWSARLARYTNPAVKHSIATLPPGVSAVPSVTLDDLANAEQAFAPEPPSIELPEELSVEQLKELLEMFESENSVLMEETRHLQKKLAESDQLVSTLERRMERAETDFTAGIKTMKEQQQKVVAERDDTIAELQRQVEDLSKRTLSRNALLDWLGCLDRARRGDAAAYPMLLELAAGANISASELLAMVKKQ